MRYGIISDIHGNWEALTAVLHQCQKQNVQAYLCLGDIVGYGANPRECLDLVVKLKAVTVAGNHDWAVSGRLDASYFTEDGKTAILWTRNKLAFEDIHRLNSLEPVYKTKEFVMVHGGLNHPSRFNYMVDTADASETFEIMDRPVCFVGHTHVPKIFICHKRVYQLPETTIEINPACRYIVNVGSVGQPRDGNPMAGYGIYDSEARTVEIKRVPYDIKTAQTKILEAGLPMALARRLSAGH